MKSLKNYSTAVFNEAVVSNQRKDYLECPFDRFQLVLLSWAPKQRAFFSLKLSLTWHGRPKLPLLTGYLF